MNRYILLSSALLCALSCVPKAKIVEQYSLKSPDAKLEMQFKLDSRGVALYSLSADNTPILDDSRLGFELRKGRTA